jgi:hypothetical protein
VRALVEIDYPVVCGHIQKNEGSTPFSIFINVFGKLIDQVMLGSVEKIQLFRETLNELKAESFDVLHEVIPSLRLLGTAHSLAALEKVKANSSAASVMAAWKDLFAVLSQSTLVLCLDDLQVCLASLYL